MGDRQIMGDIPMENVIGDGCCTQGPTAAYCPPPADPAMCPRIPCEVPASFEPCRPPADGACTCTMDCCYQQPARQPMCRPRVSFIRPTGPMESDTIYKRSYIGNTGCLRALPIRAGNSIRPFEGRMDPNTVQKLSYQAHCDVARTQPIRPRSNGLRFSGPCFDITSQKHDFVPKVYSKRVPLRVPDGLHGSCAPLEKCTINKLSYMPFDICNNPPPRPIIQVGHYIRPDAPGEKCTVQKLSYLPVPLPKKEDMPWARHARVEPPRSGPLCTTYKLSYIPNCNPQKTPAIAPISAIKITGTDMPDKNTVYKLSYLQSGGTKPDPIMPRPGIHLPSGMMEKCTVYKLSYLPQGCPARTQPIRPKGNVCKSTAPIQGITTQKHDFVPKPCSRRGLIIPPTSIATPNCPMEKCTINKLSYLPCTQTRSTPIYPKHGLGKFEAPLSKCTTYKLSYMPVPLPAKEFLPWARQSSCVRPTGPIEKCTIQKLSYGAPGTFMKKGKCGCCCAPNGPSPYPKAAVC